VLCHAFNGCETIPAISGHGKPLYLISFVLHVDIDEHMDIFLDVQASKDVGIRSGISIFQYIYHAPGTAIRYSMHVLMKGNNWAHQTRKSNPNRGCSCSAFSPCVSTSSGLVAIAEHVCGSKWLWMDIRE